MALTSTVYVFDVRLADADRNVYESLELRLARHPSESAEFLTTRLLAYCLEYAPGIAFSKGLADPDEPAIAVRDLTGQLMTWIDIGMPEAPRLHKAGKVARGVVVYPHKGVDAWLGRLSGERIHRLEELQIHAIDLDLIGGFASKLERRMSIDLSVTERDIYASIGDLTLSGSIEARQPAA